MDDDQERYLDEAKKVVKEQAYFMKKALDDAKLRDALRYSSTMLSELRTSLLSPKNYYILFMQIFDEMRVLEQYFKEEYRRGRRMIDLYESVQHCTSLIPRLYLLITVGSVYIQTFEVGAKEILIDLLEMIKAVQHPLRGLFIRYYFLKMCKDRLPDKGSEYEGEGGDINDAINVIVRNLTEMNKLWIRLGGGKSEKSKREKERVDLKVLVGENITRLSSLDGVNLEVYKATVLPKLIELIVGSKDFISQQYIIEVIIQVFPDEYHLNTLEELLDCCTTKLEAKVDIKNVFIRLMDRLADFALNSETSVTSVNKDLDIYQMFKTNIDKLVENSSSIEFKNVLDLMVAFLKFSLRCYAENSDYVNQILKSCVRICEKQHQADFDDDCQKNVVKFLTMPLDTMSLTILTMNEYPNLMKYLPFVKRRQVAHKISQVVVNLKRKLDDPQITKQFLGFISPLLQTDTDYVENEQYEFDEEQTLIAKMVHLIHSDEPLIIWEILQLFLKKFKEGGPKRQKYTIPATFFLLAKLSRTITILQYHDDQLNHNVIFEVMKELVEKNLSQNHPELALRLYLQLIQIINEVDEKKEMDEFTYDIAYKALTIYSDDLGDSDTKLNALHLIIGTINKIQCIGEENFDTLVSNITQYSSKLLKKSDQCLTVLKCSHLFYNENGKNMENVLQCFKKSLKIAGICLKQGVKNIGLYVYLTNKFLYYWPSGEVKPGDLSDCIATIKANIGDLDKENDAESEKIKVYWRNTIQIIQERRNTIETMKEINI